MSHPDRRSCRPRRALAAIGLLLLLPGAAAKAQVSTFTSLASWLAAVSAPGLDTFDDVALDAGSPPSSLSRTAGPYSYTVRANGGLFDVGPLPDVWLSTNLASTVLVFDSFSSTVRGIGGFFFGTDVFGDPLTGGTIEVAWLTTAGNGSTTLSAPTPAAFFGLVTTGTLTQLSIRDPLSTDRSFPTVNDLRLATTPPAATVPEPSTMLLSGAGLVVAGVLRRLRRS